MLIGSFDVHNTHVDENDPNSFHFPLSLLISFPSHTKPHIQNMSEFKEPIYQTLPDSISTVEYARKGNAIDAVKGHISSLLPLTVNTDSVFDAKLKNKALAIAVDKTIVQTSHRLQREKRAREVGQIKTMSSREKRQRGLFHLPKYGLVYDHYLPLNEMWQTYMLELLGPSFRLAIAEARLLKADLHGAFIFVTQSKNPDIVGCGGILLQESQETFRVITPQHTVKTIAKRGSVFAVDLSFFKVGLTTDAVASDDVKNKAVQDFLKPFSESIASRAGVKGSKENVWSAEATGATSLVIYGDQFAYRSSERMARKFKINNSIELK